MSLAGGCGLRELVPGAAEGRCAAGRRVPGRLALRRRVRGRAHVGGGEGGGESGAGKGGGRLAKA